MENTKKDCRIFQSFGEISREKNFSEELKVLEDLYNKYDLELLPDNYMLNETEPYLKLGGRNYLIKKL